MRSLISSSVLRHEGRISAFLNTILNYIFFVTPLKTEQSNYDLSLKYSQQLETFGLDGKYYSYLS